MVKAETSRWHMFSVVFNLSDSESNQDVDTVTRGSKNQAMLKLL